MKNIELGYYTTNEDWKELIDQLKEIEGLTIASIPETDYKTGLFTDYQFITVEFNNQFYYIQRETYGSCFQVTPYIKINPWNKQQADYSTDFTESEKLIAAIKNWQRYDRPLTTRHGRKVESCPAQRLYLTDGFYTIYKDGSKGMQHFQALFGNREKEIFADLDKIENTLHTKDYMILRFYSKSGDYFEYDCKSQRITN